MACLPHNYDPGNYDDYELPGIAQWRESIYGYIVRSPILNPEAKTPLQRRGSPSIRLVPSNRRHQRLDLLQQDIRLLEANCL